MEGPRAPSASEFGKLIEFLDKNLRPDSEWSIQQEYPTALAPQNIYNMRIIEDNGKVLSHAVLKPLLVKTPIGIFKVGAIGSVVTSTEHRSRGLSKQIIEECIQTARAQDCDFAILWTHLFDFYRKFGFELGGSEVSFPLRNKLPEPESDLRFIKTNKIDPAAILRLFSNHTVSTVRTFDEIRRCLDIPNSHVYSLWDAFGNLQAYAVEGKGADLSGYIHEWGGSTSKLLSLLSHIQKSETRDFTLISPGHATGLNRRLEELGESPVAGFLGMIKILNAPALFGKINRHARADLGIQDLIFEMKNGAFYLGHKDNLFKTESEADIVRLLFGPQKPTEIYPHFDEKTKESLDRILPLKMWLWGWDSI